MSQEYVITTQAELDALPESFETWTIIRIKNAPDRLVLRFHRANSQVILESSSAVLWGSSSAELRGSSSAELWESSSAVLWGSSSAELRESSSAVLWGSSSAELRGSSRADAWQNAILRVLSTRSSIGKAKDYTCIILQDVEAIAIDDKADTATVTLTKTALWNQESFLAYFDLTPVDGYVDLVKITDANGYDHHTGKIKYEGVVHCPDWDPSPTRECGGGLHVSATEKEASQYHTGLVKKVRVHLDDFVVYPHNISKVRCKKLEVIEETK